MKSYNFLITEDKIIFFTEHNIDKRIKQINKCVDELLIEHNYGILLFNSDIISEISDINTINKINKLEFESNICASPIFVKCTNYLYEFFNKTDLANFNVEAKTILNNSEAKDISDNIKFYEDEIWNVYPIYNDVIKYLDIQYMNELNVTAIV